MTKRITKKLIKSLKEGTRYGIFTNADDKTTLWCLACYNGRSICISNNGNYFIPHNVDDLCDRFGWDRHQAVTLKPVNWDTQRGCYAEI